MSIDYKILFINAVYPHDNLQNAYPPLGIGYIISYLRKKIRNPVKIAVINSNQLIKLKRFRPDLVCISSVTQNYNLAKETAGIIKKDFPHLPVVLGGVHISSLPYSLDANFDIGVIGEGEETMAELVQNFMDNDKVFDSVKGIVYRKDGKLAISEPRGMIHDLDALSPPERASLPGKDNQLLLTSRGCPYRCGFCASGVFWQGVRYFSPRYVVEEVKRIIKNFPVLNLTIYDDLFIFNKKRLAEISDLIARSGIHKKINFWCNARANHIDEEAVSLLKRMNVKGVGVGFESGSNRVLKNIKSDNVSIEINKKAIDICKKNNIFVHGSFMIGCPDESEEDMVETYNFIKDSGLNKGEISVATPLPGTRFWEYALKEGLVGTDMDWSRLSMRYSGNLPDPDNLILLSRGVNKENFLRIFDLIVRDLQKKTLVYETQWEQSQGALIKMNNLFSLGYFQKFIRDPYRGLRYINAYISNKLARVLR